jgi:hypothetical protein
VLGDKPEAQVKGRISFSAAMNKFFVLSLLFCGGILRADVLTALDDSVVTASNVPVAIAVLANDAVVAGNQTAILRITQPLHGKVVVNQGAVSNAELSRLFQFAAVQLSNTVAQVADTNSYPWYTLANGQWATESPSDNAWITGFFPGALWLIYEHTGDTNYRTWAENWMAAIVPMQFSTNTDDVGFMINTSFGNGYRLTGNPDYKAVLLQAAQSLSNLFNRFVGCVGVDLEAGTATNPPQFEVLMDTMMNTKLLYTAYDLGGSSNLYAMAVSHAGRTLTNQIRADGSTFHLAVYNTTNGDLIYLANRAISPPLDTWARGHSWAINAFTTVFQETGDARFLDAAKRVADYYIANVPPDFVPYWYFTTNGVPSDPPLRDSSAAAISLSGLLQLSQLVTNASDGARYWQAALNVFNSLSSTNYLAEGSNSSGILLHGDSVDMDTDDSLIYGDYYFVESLKRLNDVYGQTTVTYFPDTNYSGADSFTYQACDSSGASSTATVSVMVGLAPNPAVAISSNGLPAISFPTSTGVSYFVQYANALTTPVSWNVLATNIAGNGSVFSISDTNFVSPRFYRVGMRF